MTSPSERPHDHPHPTARRLPPQAEFRPLRPNDHYLGAQGHVLIAAVADSRPHIILTPTADWERIAKALWAILDDIDSASDHFHPPISDYVNFVNGKANERQMYLANPDGKTLIANPYMPPIRDGDPMVMFYADVQRYCGVDRKPPPPEPARPMGL